MPQMLYPWIDSPQYALDKRFSHPHRQTGHSGQEINLCHCQESNPRSLGPQPAG